MHFQMIAIGLNVFYHCAAAENEGSSQSWGMVDNSSMRLQGLNFVGLGLFLPSLNPWNNKVPQMHCI